MDDKTIGSQNDDSFDSTYEELTENIAEYYKNEPDEEPGDEPVNETEEKTVIEDEPKKDFFKLFRRNDKATVNVIGGTEAPDEIHVSFYGMTARKKFYITLASSIAVSLALIGCSVIIALNLPRSSDADEAYIEELRQQDDYVELQKEYATLSKEVNDLDASLAEKKEKVEYIDDYDNKKAELTLKIDSQKQQINDITYNINQKTTEIAELDKIIADRSGTIITLSPGRYVVGTNIAAGKYSVSGAGKLSVASSDNKSKVNTVIGSSSYEVELNNGDIVNIEMTAKFTSVN